MLGKRKQRVVDFEWKVRYRPLEQHEIVGTFEIKLLTW